MTVRAELDMGLEYLEVDIAYRITKRDGKPYAEYEDCISPSEYFVICPSKRREVGQKAMDWVNENAPLLIDDSNT